MLSHLKRRIGVLTAVAVLAALVPTLAVSPASAAIKSGTSVVAPSDAAVYSACPSGSAAAAGFTDTTSTDVDCVKTHGITQGTTATTYSPTDSVPRWQMALYLTRFATSAAVTLGSGADQGFTDISGESAEIQTAINQLKQLGVTNGTTATTYSPADNVTREQMAMFVERMLNKVTPAPGACGTVVASCTALLGVTANGGNATHWNYTDIDTGAVTFEGHNAIVEMYHLGVPGHTSTNSTFGPLGAIDRAEMATWMTNALAHTNARPEGLWLQTDKSGACSTCYGTTTVTLHISNRDASRQPVTGTLVDVFSDLVTTTTSTEPFSSTGACLTTNTDIEGGATECTIAVGDASTDLYGNIAVTPTATALGTSRNYYAWTGATGATYNNSTAPGRTVGTTAAKAEASSTLTTTVPTNALSDGSDANYYFMPYGTDVTVTVQLKDAAGASVARPNVAVSVAETTKVENDVGDGTVTNSAADILAAAKTTTGVTAADGSFTYTLSSPADPSSSVTTNRTHVQAVFTVTGAAAVNVDGASGTSVKIAFNDDAAYNGAVTLTQGSYFGVGVALASGGVARTALASVWDQYGRARAGQTVTFEQTTDDGGTDNLNGAVGSGDSFTDDVTRVTDSTGVATLGYTDTNTETAKHTVWAWYEADGNKARASNAAEPEASSIFYRLESVPTASFEIDSPEDGAVGGTTFGTSGGTWTWAGAHGLTTGASFKITVADGSTGTAAGEIHYVLTGSGTTMTTSLTRTGTATTGDAAANNTTGQARQLEVWTDGDSLYEIVRWDDANNTLVIRQQSATAGNGAYDYQSFTYESDDQFMTNGDNDQQLPAALKSTSAVSLAAFETALKTKMTLASGYALPDTGAGKTGDIYQLVPVNHGANPGVSVIHLGQ